MKKVFLLTILSLISLGINAQKVSTIVDRGDTTTTVTDNSWIRYAEIETIGETGETKAVRLNPLFDGIATNATDISDNALGIDSLKTGVINAKWYLNAAQDNHEDAIQQAINVAHDLRSSSGVTVLCPGDITWEFDTQTDTLKSWVTVKFERFGRVSVPADHTIDALFVNEEGEALIKAGIIGGNYFGSQLGAHDWSVFKGKFDSSSEYAVGCYFEPTWVENSGIVFDIDCNGNGYFTDCHIGNGESWYATAYLKSRSDGTYGANFGGNFLYNIAVQGGDSAVNAFDIEGTGNQGTNLFVWDWTQGVNNRKTLIFGANSSYNRFDGWFVADSIQDLGRGNKIYGPEGFQRPISDSLRIHSWINGDWAISNNRLIISGAGTAGSAGSPNYNALKMYGPSGSASASSSTGSNASVRILGGNESAANYSSHMVLQVHGSTNDNAESAYIDAIKIDGSESGFVYLSDAMKLTPRAAPPTEATEGVIYMDTDHHLYVHNGTTWVQLDN